MKWERSRYTLAKEYWRGKKCVLGKLEDKERSGQSGVEDCQWRKCVGERERSGVVEEYWRDTKNVEWWSGISRGELVSCHWVASHQTNGQYTS